ncbi:IcmT/TraK family protein (plasmid) [Stutzerimonas stutzeri]|uniref:IcmT/TraK family protein n=1 Tax=Stutzerimonas stutzeri group TaxID=136846 RepID=UPI001AAF7184|nr:MULTISPECIES: IcmT/TraK family protein [Stutzerimonas stutzeri group]QTF59088.1 IcmT/TraK family protein [Stutzerimonas frequens]QUE78380.1 IcmT/TraK family protein [Stutzerimonas stutzeri]
MRISIWQHAGRTPKIFGIPCMAFLPIFIWLFHMRLWTFGLACFVIAFFTVLSHFGLTFTVLWGKVLHLVRGPRIFARPWWYRNRFQDIDR